MTQEILDKFDENYIKIGTTSKSEARANGYWVHSFHCWILMTTSTPSMLLQKRAATKALFPNFLDISAAGHLQSGEKPSDGVREISEEVGIFVNVDQMLSLGVKIDVAKLGDIINRQFCHVYLYPAEIVIDDLKLDKTELDGIVEMTIEDGIKLFSGAVSSVEVRGIEKNANGEYSALEKRVSTKDFIPRIDPYYYKMFINADLYLRGYKHLSI